jgi:hypothetical protein
MQRCRLNYPSSGSGMSGQGVSPQQMLDWSQLIAPVPPWGHFLACSEHEIDDAILRFRYHAPERNDVAVCVTRGYHCQTKTDLFDEWSAALRFPYYFGHNWDAFHECIRDMAWLPAKSYIYVVTSADRLLIADDRGLHILLDLFASSAEEWAQYVEGGPQWPRNALFHVLFQCDPTVGDATRRRLEMAGAHLEDLVLAHGNEDI